MDHRIVLAVAVLASFGCTKAPETPIAPDLQPQLTGCQSDLATCRASLKDLGAFKTDLAAQKAASDLALEGARAEAKMAQDALAAEKADRKKAHNRWLKWKKAHPSCQ